MPDPSRHWYVPAMAGLVVLAVALRSTSLIHHDVAWSLYLTGRYLEGARLYADIIEVNPPLIYWLMAPGVFFAKLAGLAPTAALKAQVFVSALASLWLSSLILKRVESAHWRLATLLIAFALLILPGENFGQREHFLVILSMPYLVLIAARRQREHMPSWLVVTAAATGAVGFLLKPYFLLVPAVLELYLLVSIGWHKTIRRPEPWLLLAAGIAYVAAVLHFTPEYLSVIIKYANEVYQTGYGRSLMATAWRGFLPVVLAAGAVAWHLKRRPSQPGPLIEVFGIAASCLFVAYMVQSKGWHYQSQPMQAMLIVAVPLMLLGGRHLWWGDRMHNMTTHAVLLALAVAILNPLLSPTYRYPQVGYWLPEITKRPGTTSILIMSANVYQGFPLVNEANVTWASRFPCLWLMPGLLHKQQQLGGSTPLLDEIEAYNQQAIVEDIERYRPQLVLVDVRPDKSHFEGIRFEYIDKLSASAAFRKVWRNYKKTDHARGFDIYERIAADA